MVRCHLLHLVCDHRTLPLGTHEYTILESENLAKNFTNVAEEAHTFAHSKCFNCTAEDPSLDA